MHTALEGVAGRSEGMRDQLYLATGTQVIFLAHHEHLMSVARAAIGSDGDVVTL